jgi:hypothetical protein
MRGSYFVGPVLYLLQSYALITTDTQGSAKPPPRLRKAYVAATRRGMCVLKPSRAHRSLRRRPGSPSDFGAGFGPRGLGNLAQALAWVCVGLRKNFLVGGLFC